MYATCFKVCNSWSDEMPPALPGPDTSAIVSDCGGRVVMGGRVDSAPEDQGYR
jgi:hypothetical protein